MSRFVNRFVIGRPFPSLRNTAGVLSALAPAVLLLANLCAAQAPTPSAGTAPARAQPESVPPPPPGAQVLHAGTRLVTVDVVVQDRDGHAIHGLTGSDFTLLESKTPQVIRNFEEHAAAPHSTLPPPDLKLPPGTFTDYTAVPPDGALNILLLDALNTPMADQAFVRTQLQEYVKKANPGTNIAIFGLGSRLVMLQGFTTQPQMLKDAVEHRLIPHASVLLDDPAGSNTEPDSLSGDISDMASGNAAMAAGLAQTVANLQQFEAQTQSFQLQLRLQYTLDAFNQLARYLSAFPGRKNLIWFSGSFPIDILPDASLQDPFGVVANGADEFRETTGLLTRAQVAVYPIDARGLMTNPAFDASRSGKSLARSPTAMAAELTKFDTSQAAEHATMEQMADDTGGHAFFNTNGLADAVAKAIDAGSNYYTLTYTPTNRNLNGDYRALRVDLNGAAAGRGLKLSYRHGYYADDPERSNKAVDVATNATLNAVAEHTEQAYVRATMARGAPTPEDILFKVRVLPASNTTEPAVAPENHPDTTGRLKGPFRRFDVDFAALPGGFTLTAGPNGMHTGTLEFEVLVYTPDGKLLNSAGRSLNLSLDAERYKQFMRSGLGSHIEVSAPIKQESYFRIAVHDLQSNHFGVVEIPAATVGRMAPPVYPNQSKPAPPAPTPQPPASLTTPPPGE